MKAVSQNTMVSLLFMAGLVMAANQTSDCQSLLHSGLNELSTPTLSQHKDSGVNIESTEIEFDGSLLLRCW